MYAELHCHSNFSFLYGASHPQELVKQAALLNYQALALTDECSFAGIVKAHVAAKEHNIKLIVGSSFELPERGTLLLLAHNKKAYQNISTLITAARRRAPKGRYEIIDADLQRHGDGIAIWLPPLQHPNNSNTAQYLQQLFPQRLWLGVHQLQHAQERQHYHYIYTLAVAHNIPMVACGNVCMHVSDRKPLQDVLTAIRINKSVHTISEHLQSNAEQYLRPIPKLQKCLPHALLHESCVIANLCDFSMDELRYQYPQKLVPKPYTPSDYLRYLSIEGANKRWSNGVPPAIAQQIDVELALIKDLAYEYYFLTVWDIVLFARNHNILCQGRGSAANSVVCYCLFITEVSPEQTDLLFERFLSKERNEPPDIDVDFEHERREEVIQYIYKKYGRDKAALAATVVSYRARSAIRDVGKALGLDPLFIDQLLKSLAWWDRLEDLKKKFKQHNFGSGQQAELFMQLVQQILGFPRHLSQHVGGFIITDQAISNLVPVENAAMDERTIIQWDKTDIEAMGLLKVDVLGLGMLTVLRKSFELIRQVYNTPISLSTVPQGDPKTYSMLCNGDSLGVFQVESRAQMAMLPRLQPRCYYDLVIQVAIVRPGPIQGDMVHPYLRRREGSEAISYPSKAVEATLKRTLGIPIFQEQVIKLAMVAAGFSGGEADQLRRAMASWGKNGNLQKFKDKLINGMLSRGYSADFSQRLFQQMQGFGEYGFPESHAASFALIVYVSAWLKCHYPAAFYCALLNSQPMGFYSASQICQDAKRHNITVQPIDIRYSQWDSSLEHTAPSTHRHQHPAMRLGLRLIKGLDQRSANRLLQTQSNAPYNNLQDLQHRAQLNQACMSVLIEANAVAHLSQHRRQSHWQNQGIETEKPLLKALEQRAQHSLNDAVQLKPASVFENMVRDYNSTGLSLTNHPLRLLRSQTPFNRCTKAAQLTHHGHKRFVRVAGLVTGRQRPGTASGVVFLTLEDETGNINVIVWKATQDHFRQALLSGKLLLVTGTAESKNGVCHIIAGRIDDLSERLSDAQLKSRDFH